MKREFLKHPPHIHLDLQTKHRRRPNGKGMPHHAQMLIKDAKLNVGTSGALSLELHAKGNNELDKYLDGYRSSEEYATDYELHLVLDERCLRLIQMMLIDDLICGKPLTKAGRKRRRFLITEGGRAG